MNEQIVIDNLLISYSHFGLKAASKNLLFLHGWRLQKEIWNQVINQLVSRSASKQISYFSIDLPGFGGSQAPSKAMTVGDYTEVVQKFIEKLDLKNTIIIGHSFGGRIGIKLAAVHPELVSKLVLVDSAGFAIGPNKKSLMNSAAKIAKPFFKPKFMQPLRKKIYEIMGSEDYLATPHLQQTFINVVNEDLTRHFSQLKCPTLIIWGENDKETPVEYGEKMHSLIPNSQLQILGDAGHFSFLEKPSEFVEELRNFISK